MPKQATFTEMLNGTAEDYAIIGQETSQYAKHLPERILEHLAILNCLLYTSDAADEP